MEQEDNNKRCVWF